MKKLIFYPTLAIIAFFLSSCATDDKSLVQETCEKFVDAILTGDLTTARSMVTPETYEKWGGSGELLNEVMHERWKAAKTKISNIKIEGDHAQATFAIGFPSELKGEITTLHLQKYGKVWLIHEPGILVKEVIKDETVIMDVEK